MIHREIPLILIELVFILIAIVLAFCCPRMGSGFFQAVERGLGRIARRRALSIFLCGAAAFTLRLLLLPVSPIPLPYIHDDFSWLLAADTFAHWRLTNPTPAMWMHFESFHIDMKPTYMSMYFPAQGMVMAAGQIIAGNPWYGLLAACSLMCAAFCWMLQGWLPPGWALLGGMLAVVRLALFSYWIDTYTGAGAIAALGGALVLGAFPRIKRHFRTRDFFWMGLGLAILATSRPYEGLLVSVPVIIALLWWFRKSKVRTGHAPAESCPGAPKRLLRQMPIRRLIPGVLVVAGMFSFMAYYDYRVFGNVFTPPYKVNRDAYGVVQHFLWLPLRPEPVYRHRIMRDFYARPVVGSEMKYYRDETRSAVALFKRNLRKLYQIGLFYFGIALMPPLVMLPWAFRDRRIRLLAVTTGVVAAGLIAETFFLQHYLAPATVILYALLLQCMRHLRVRGARGLLFVRAVPVVCIALGLLRVWAQPLHLRLAPNPHKWAQSWYGVAPLGRERARVLAKLESLPGLQLAVVAYAPHHILNDWVYNSADIDHSKVIWARQMDAASDRKLLDYYKNRKAWLVNPDAHPPTVVPYRIGDLPGSSDMIRSVRASRLAVP
jgi:hypothetical protein